MCRNWTSTNRFTAFFKFETRTSSADRMGNDCNPKCTSRLPTIVSSIQPNLNPTDWYLKTVNLLLLMLINKKHMQKLSDLHPIPLLPFGKSLPIAVPPQHRLSVRYGESRPSARQLSDNSPKAKVSDIAILAAIKNPETPPHIELLLPSACLSRTLLFPLPTSHQWRRPVYKMPVPNRRSSLSNNESN